MKYIGLFLMALLLNLTASYAQTGNIFIVKGDTLIGYNKAELEKIATRIVRSHECDTLLLLGELQLAKKNIALQAKDSALSAKDSIIFQKVAVIDLKEEIILGKDDEITQVRKANKKLKTNFKLAKVGLYASFSALFVSIVLHLTK